MRGSGEWVGLSSWGEWVGGGRREGRVKGEGEGQGII